MRKNDEILYVKAFVLLYLGGKKSDNCHLTVKETQGKICHTGRREREQGLGYGAPTSGQAGCPSCSSCYANIHTPPTASHSHSAPVPDTGAQEAVVLAPPLCRDQLENPVLVPGTQGPGLVS